MKTLVEASKEQLCSMQDCIAMFSPEEYASPLPALSGSSIGMHLRHVIEFYQHLLQVDEHINYDSRERSQALERSPEHAWQTTAQIIALLECCENDRALKLQFDCQKGAPALIATSMARELCYNLEHCIHHLALVKTAMLVYFPEKQLSSDFGLAYSTKKHNQTKQLHETALVGEAHKI